MAFLRIFAVFVLLTACADRSQSPTVPEALSIGSNKTVFAATGRVPEADGTYGYDRSANLRLLELTVSIPPNHTPGSLNFSYANPNPNTQFTIAARKEFPSEQAFLAGLKQDTTSRSGALREVTIFVHGFNATQAETAFRAAQIATDIDLPGAMVIYSWPSKGKPLAYAYDGDSALFARDGLESLLRKVKASGVDRIVLTAHSLGSLIVMETLRQMEISDPGWAGNNLTAVILMSPDLDVDVFHSQLARLSKVPEPFIVFVSGNDKALNISARLRGTHDTERLGSVTSVQTLRNLPIEVIDTTALSNTAQSSHFVTATSPAVLAMVRGARELTDTFGPDYIGLEQSFMGMTIRAGQASAVVLKAPGDSPR